MSNKAAWITGPKAKPLKVDDAPLSKPRQGQVLIKNAAVAVNPVDWKIQDYDFYVKHYPNILGTDVAGTVEQIGDGVEHLKLGQRVIGHCINLANSRPGEGGFQFYTICPYLHVSPIPDSLTFEQAVVLPLAISTASMGLYHKDGLNLPFPTLDGRKESSKKTVVVLGGSSSVGGVAVQLCIASGLNVISTASPKNHAYVKSLGATSVIDHADPKLFSTITSELGNGQDFAGIYDAISTPETFSTTYSIAFHFSSRTIPIAHVLTTPEDQQKPPNAKLYHVFAAILGMQTPEIARAVWNSFVPAALEAGVLKPLPEALVVGKGLEKIQDGLERQKEGVSARKVVVSL